MGYNTVAIKKDVDGKPIPQYFNPITNQYEDLQGLSGASKTIVYDVDGNAIDLVALIANIVTAINTTGTKQDEIKAAVDNIYNKDTTKTIYGLSTDTKPTANMEKGNRYFEINTGDVYMWNGSSWVVI